MILLSIVVTFAVSQAGRAFPRGAPAEACESLLPRHYGTGPQDAQEAPYSFLASSKHYHYRMDGIQGPNRQGVVGGFQIMSWSPNLSNMNPFVISPGNPNSCCQAATSQCSGIAGPVVQLTGPRFKGFLIAAMDPETHERIGHWYTVKGTKTLPCSAITHSDPFPKKRVILLWKPPTDRPKGEVIFVATVLQSFENYYSGFVAGIPRSENTHDPNGSYD